jgi:hypothetical protein
MGHGDLVPDIGGELLGVASVQLIRPLQMPSGLLESPQVLQDDGSIEVRFRIGLGNLQGLPELRNSSRTARKSFRAAL